MSPLRTIALSVLMGSTTHAGLVLSQVIFDTDVELPGSTLIVEIGGELVLPNPDWEHDQIVFNGSFNPDGATLEIALVDLTCGPNPYQPELGDEFPIFVYNGGTPAASSHTFATFDLPTLSAGLKWNTGDIHTTGVLSVTAVPESSAILCLGAVTLVVSTFVLIKKTGSCTPKHTTPPPT